MSETSPDTLVAKPEETKIGDWADPSFFSKRVGRIRGFWKLMWSLVVPPQGHRTVPTTSGWVLIALSMGIGMAAYNTSSNILFMTLAILLSSLILSGVLSILNFKGTRWRLHFPVHFRAGEPARLQVEVENEKKLLPTYGIWFNIQTDEMKKADRIYLENRLDPQKDTRLDWLYTPPRRGVIRVEISGIESQYPFGFLRKTIGNETKREVRVWPERIDYGWTPPSGQETHLKGHYLRKLGTGADLISLRDYKPGDPPRQVHWKASARLGQLMVRENADEAHSGFVLFFETAASLWRNEEQFERLCRLAASIAEDLYRDGRLLGVAINDEPLMVIRRINDLHLFMDRLSEVEPEDHYKPGPDPMGSHVISFKPDGERGLFIFISGNESGTVKP